MAGSAQSAAGECIHRMRLGKVRVTNGSGPCLHQWAELAKHGEPILCPAKGRAPAGACVPAGIQELFWLMN